eukprot:751415-Hanusia_phi.AAC.2
MRSRSFRIATTSTFLARSSSTSPMLHIPPEYSCLVDSTSFDFDSTWQPISLASTVGLFGSDTAPSCMWSPDNKTLIVKVGKNPSFKLDSLVLPQNNTGYLGLSLFQSPWPPIMIQKDPAKEAYDGILTNPVSPNGVVSLAELNFQMKMLAMTLPTNVEMQLPTSFGFPPNAYQSIRLSSFIQPSIPTPGVKIDGFSEHDECAIIRLDARRSVEWKILEQPAGTTGLRIAQSSTYQLVAYLTCNPDDNCLNGISCNVSCMVSGSYKVQLNLTNFVGKSGLSTFSLVMRRDAKLGRVRISGDREQFFNLTDDIALQGISNFSTACQTNYSVTFAWTYGGTDQNFSNAFQNSNIMKNSLNLFIPSFSLPFKVGVMYPFNFTVTQLLGTVRQQSSTVWISMIASDPVAEIVGRNRLVSYVDDLILDGTRSYDPNIPMSLRTWRDLTYCWSCTDLSTNMDILSSQQPIWNISAGTLAPNRAYNIRLRVFFYPQQTDVCTSPVTPQSYYGEDNVRITTYLAPVSIPHVQITSELKLKYNVNEKIRLTGLIFASPSNSVDMVETSWSIDPPTANIQSAATVQVDPNRYSTGVARGTVSLVLDPGTLLASQDKYSITLLGTFAGLTSTASVDIVVNRPPSLGDFRVSPSSGIAMQTQFAFEAPFWDDEDLPLSIEFGFVDYRKTSNNLVQLNSKSEEIRLLTILPKGNSNLQVYCLVTDALGAVTRANCGASSSQDCTVIVNGPPDDPSTSINAILAAGDPSKILALTSISLMSLPSGSSFLGPVLEQGLNTALGMVESPNLPDSLRSQLGTSMLSVMSAVSSMAPAEQAAMLASSLQFYDKLLADKTIALDDNTASSVLAGLAMVSKLSATALSSRRSAASDAATKCITMVDDAVKAAMRARVDGESYTTETSSLNITATRKAVDQLSQSGLSFAIVNIPNRFDMISLPADVGTVASAALASITGSSGMLDTIVQVHELNPYASLGPAANTSRSSSVVLNFYQAGTVGDGTVPASVQVSNLANPITLSMQVFSVPPENRSNITGIRTLVGCGYWDDATAQWKTDIQTVNPLATPGLITCKTTHATTFSAVDTLAGCDGLISDPLKVNNKCQVCQDQAVDLPLLLVVLCVLKAWNPCLPPMFKNKCAVCVNQTTAGAAFGSTLQAHLATREISGQCDYQGNVCLGTQEVSVCGLCVDRSANKALLTVQSEGICDCVGSGQPNGGAVVDCCGQCNGMNVNLDYCGMYAGICIGNTPVVDCPASFAKCPVSRIIPNNLVCHSEVRAAREVQLRSVLTCTRDRPRPTGTDPVQVATTYRVPTCPGSPQRPL